MRDFVREDGSVNHIVVYDPETGKMKESLGGQGYGVGSSWTRGQSWGIYGFALSYRFTGDTKYLETSKKIAVSRTALETFFWISAIRAGNL